MKMLQRKRKGECMGTLLELYVNCGLCIGHMALK